MRTGAVKMVRSGNPSGHHLFRELRSRYLERLAEAAPRLRLALERGLTVLPLSGLTHLRDEVHRLAGSGATYGFPMVSELAFATEDSLDGVLGGSRDRSDLDRDFRGLLDAVDAAIDVYREEQHFERIRASREFAPSTDVKSAACELIGNVVIVDDDPSVSDLLWTAFSREGFNAEVVRDGVAAMASIKHRIPDVVVLDRALPVMSGTSVLLKLQEDKRTANIPVIILSAKPPSAWFESQKVQYIQKPFMPEAIVSAAVAMMDGSYGEGGHDAGHSPS